MGLRYEFLQRHGAEQGIVVAVGASHAVFASRDQGGYIVTVEVFQRPAKRDRVSGHAGASPLLWPPAYEFKNGPLDTLTVNSPCANMGNC